MMKTFISLLSLIHASVALVRKDGNYCKASPTPEAKAITSSLAIEWVYVTEYITVYPTPTSVVQSLSSKAANRTTTVHITKTVTKGVPPSSTVNLVGGIGGETRSKVATPPASSTALLQYGPGLPGPAPSSMRPSSKLPTSTVPMRSEMDGPIHSPAPQASSSIVHAIPSSSAAMQPKPTPSPSSKSSALPSQSSKNGEWNWPIHAPYPRSSNSIASATPSSAAIPPSPITPLSRLPDSLTPPINKSQTPAPPPSSPLIIQTTTSPLPSTTPTSTMLEIIPITTIAWSDPNRGPLAPRAPPIPAPSSHTHAFALRADEVFVSIALHDQTESMGMSTSTSTLTIEKTITTDKLPSSSQSRTSTPTLRQGVSSQTSTHDIDIVTSVLPHDHRCPYPYPGIKCGARTTLVTKARSTKVTTKAGQTGCKEKKYVRLTRTTMVVVVLVTDVVLGSVVASTVMGAGCCGL